MAPTGEKKKKKNTNSWIWTNVINHRRAWWSYTTAARKCWINRDIFSSWNISHIFLIKYFTKITTFLCLYLLSIFLIKWQLFWRILDLWYGAFFFSSAHITRFVSLLIWGHLSVHIVLPTVCVTGLFVQASPLGSKDQSVCSHSFNYAHVMYWLRAIPRLASLIWWQIRVTSISPCQK